MSRRRNALTVAGFALMVASLIVLTRSPSLLDFTGLAEPTRSAVLFVAYLVGAFAFLFNSLFRHDGMEARR